METLDQYVIPLLRRVKKYKKGTRHDIVEDVFHNKVNEVITYRCRSCGQFKTGTKLTVCETCASQLEMFV